MSIPKEIKQRLLFPSTLNGSFSPSFSLKCVGSDVSSGGNVTQSEDLLMDCLYFNFIHKVLFPADLLSEFWKKRPIPSKWSSWTTGAVARRLLYQLGEIKGCPATSGIISVADSRPRQPGPTGRISKSRNRPSRGLKVETLLNISVYMRRPVLWVRFFSVNNKPAHFLRFFLFSRLFLANQSGSGKRYRVGCVEIIGQFPVMMCVGDWLPACFIFFGFF